MSGLRQSWNAEFYGLRRKRNLVRQEMQLQRVELAALDSRIEMLARQRPPTEREREELRS